MCKDDEIKQIVEVEWEFWVDSTLDIFNRKSENVCGSVKELTLLLYRRYRMRRS